MSDSARKIECTVRDSKFVEPCDALAELIDTHQPGFSRKRGMFQTTYSNIHTHEPSRSFVGIKCDAYKNGMLFNFCPVCGTDISAPFTEKDEPLPPVTPTGNTSSGTTAPHNNPGLGVAGEGGGAS